MGVTGVEPHWEGQTGSGQLSQLEMTAVWQVFVSSPFDGPLTVLSQGLAFGLPLVGTFYNVGNDFNPLLTLRTLVPTRKSGTRLIWFVVGTYQSAGSQQDHHDGTDENGKPTKDPLKFHDEIDISYAQFSRPVERAKLISPAIPGRGQNTWGPVVNSAGAVYAPPLERDQNRYTLKITKNLSSCPTAQQDRFQSAPVNSDNFTISKSRLGFVRSFKKYQVKMKNIGGKLQFQNDVVFWPVTYEMDIDTEFGWRDVLDKGLAASARAGDPDGMGGTISNTDIRPGQPQMRRFVDAAGVPLSEPVLLDGNGQALLPGRDPVYLTYQKYDETPFSGQNFTR